MDRLVNSDVKELSLRFSRGQKCSATFKITNLMHTMSVALSVTTTNKNLFSVSQPFSIIPPLSSSTYTISMSQGLDTPPVSAPLDSVLVRSSMLPTGKANQDDLRRLFSKLGPHIFKDAVIPISFVGPQVVDFLLSPASRTLEVSFLLSRAISGCDESELTSLLRCAAEDGNCYFVSSLIEAGADVNGRDSDGNSAMTLAVRSGNSDAVEILIDSGYAIDNSVDLFLHDAARTNQVDLVEILCLAYIDIDLNTVDSQGRTALHIAADLGHVDVIQFLVSVGGDPKIADCDGWTPLHCASFEGHGEAVTLLLNHSAQVKYAMTNTRKTPFALATDKVHSHLYDSLQLGDMLHKAARTGDIHSIKSSLAEGADVNGRDQNGWTPLHRAAFKGRLESVKLLISHGARIEVVDDSGHTPLHLAVEAGHLQIALHLIAHGRRANLKSLQGLLPADFDCFKNYPIGNTMCQDIKKDKQLSREEIRRTYY